MTESFGSSIFKNSSFKKTLASLKADSSNEKEKNMFSSDLKLRSFDTVVSEKCKRRLEFSETKTSFYFNEGIMTPNRKKISHNPQRKEVGGQGKEKQTTVQEVLNKTIKLINSQYKKDIDWSDYSFKQENKKKVAQFNESLRQTLLEALKNIKSKPKQLASHLNAIYYSSSSIKIHQFSYIEKQVMRDWKQNPILITFRSQWFVLVQKFIPEFGAQAQHIFTEIILDQFCNLLGYLTYIIFKNYFALEVTRKTKEQILNRLSNQTMRYIITQSNQWQNVVMLSIQEMLSSKIKKSVMEEQTRNYLTQIVINQMGMQPLKQYLHKAHQDKEQLFPETQSAIALFTKQHNLKSKIKSITDIRVCMEQDILTYQKILLEQDKINQLKMFQKDGMLTCLIIAFLGLRNKNILNCVELSLREIRLMLGSHFQQILGINKCPSYYADLQSAVDFLDYQIKNRIKN